MNQVVDHVHFGVWEQRHIRPIGLDERGLLYDQLVNSLLASPLVHWLREDNSLSERDLTKLLFKLICLEPTHLLANEALTACVAWSSPKDHPQKSQALLKHVFPLLKKGYVSSKLANEKLKGIRQLQMAQQKIMGYHINLLWVHPENRRQGLATDLLEPLIEKSMEHSLAISVEVTDHLQLEIFRHLNFHVVDSQDLPGGPTVWRMNRTPV